MGMDPFAEPGPQSHGQKTMSFVPSDPCTMIPNAVSGGYALLLSQIWGLFVNIFTR